MRSNLPKSNLSELKNKIMFTILGIIVFRIGAHIPLPGVDLDQLRNLFYQNKGSMLLHYMDLFSGGALSNMSLFTLGIAPYISASIFIQLSSYTLPHLQELRKDGNSGKEKMSGYTRYLALLLSITQGLVVTKLLISNNMVLLDPATFYVLSIITLCTGTMSVMWIGDQTTHYGIGNGVSMIIFSGIVSRLPEACAKLASQVKQGVLQKFTLWLVIALVIAVIGFVVTMERGQRKLLLSYPRRQHNRSYTNQQSSTLPLKVNMVGVMPTIITQTLILFPVSMTEMLSRTSFTAWLQPVVRYLQPGEPIYMLLFISSVIAFTFYLTAVLHSSDDIAENVKRSGALINGLRPGKKTAEYIDSVLLKLTLFGGIYLAMVSILPDIITRFFNVPLPFAGTSLLIAVVVVMEVMAQVQSYFISGLTNQSGKKQKPLMLLH